MKKSYLAAVSFISSLVLAFATSAAAQIVRMGGGLRPGHARPPLFLNLNPHDATSNYGPYSPAQVRRAYGVDQLGATGSGQKIGIVDAYGDPSIQKDLDNFCSYYGLSSTAIQIVYPQGKVRRKDSGWALETALDVEWAHAIAPDATIILTVAKSSSLTDLLGAVDAAVGAGANVVSMSWGAQEFSGADYYDSHFQAPGVTYFASSGDAGELATPYEVEWPASSPYVIGVGGTTLYLNAAGTPTSPDGGPTPSETAWSGSGGGVSSVYAQPTFQAGWSDWLGLGNLTPRCVPDVAYLADPNTGVGVVYGSFVYEVGGTSAGAPQWAALVALADSVSTSGPVAGNADIYSVAGTAPDISGNFFDITEGSNDSTPDEDDYAVPGYDLVTGLGSPTALNLVSALAPQNPDFSVSASPGSQTVAPGASASYTVTIDSLNGYSGTVNFNASDLPSGATASFSPSSVSGGSSSSTLTITTSSAILEDSYPITVTATDGTLTHTATVTLVVAKPDFSVSVSPSSQTVAPGGSTSYTVTVDSISGFSGTVDLSVSGLTGVATVGFDPTSVIGSGSSTLTVTADSGIGDGNYSFTLTGTSSTATHTTSATLVVKTPTTHGHGHGHGH